MRKTINIDFNNSSSITLGHSGDILYSCLPFWAKQTHTHGALMLYNLSGTSQSNGLTLSAAPPEAAANAVYGGNYVSLVTSGANTTIHISGLQPAGPYLTTAANPFHNHGGVPSVTGFIGGTIGSAGWSLSIPDFLLTAAESDHAHSQYIPIGHSTRYASSYLANTFLTTAARVTHVHGVASGTNITIGSSSNGLALSVRDAIGTNTSIIGGSMTADTRGITLNIPAGSGGTYVGGVGTGFTSVSTSGSDIAATLGTDGINLGVPAYLTTAMQSNAGSNFLGTNASIVGGSMTANSSGITLNIPMATATAANAIHAGDYILLSSMGGDTTISVSGLQATSAMSNYQLTANNSLFLGTGATQSFLHNSDATLFIARSDSSRFQHTSVNSQSLGTTYTSHTHSNLYLPLSASTAYQTSVLRNTFAVTSHTHPEASVYFVNSLGSNITWGSSVSGSNTSIFATAGGGGGGGSTISGGVAIQGSGTYIHSSGTVRFSNSNGLFFGLSNGTMTASLSQASLAFNDSNGVSFGLYSSNASGSTVTASVYTNYAQRTHTHGNVSLNLVNISGSYSSASGGLTLSLTGNTGGGSGAPSGIVGLGNQNTVPFTSGSVRVSGVNLTVNTVSSGANQYLQVSGPPMGYLFFSNIPGFSWGSSVNELSTYMYLITA